MTTRSKEELLEELSRLEAQLAGHVEARAAEAATARADRHRLTMLESMMETVPIGVVIADAQGRIIHGNSQVERMLCHPVLYSEDVESYGEWISYHEDGRRVESGEYPLSLVLRDGHPRSEIDVHYQRGDGTRFWLRIIGEPVRNAAGETIGATVALIDIDRERQLQATQEHLIAELNHRVKNAFAVVKSIVGQSLRGADVPPAFRATLDERLDAYAKAHSRLVSTVWDTAPLASVADDVLSDIAGDRVRVAGPVAHLPSKQALAFSMALYELATNAIKYGALSVPSGTVDFTWSKAMRDDEETLVASWVEAGGPVPMEPERTGFGSIITTRAIAFETDGVVETEFSPRGLVWRLVMPWPTVEQDAT